MQTFGNREQAGIIGRFAICLKQAKLDSDPGTSVMRGQIIGPGDIKKIIDFLRTPDDSKISARAWRNGLQVSVRHPRRIPRA